MNGQTEFGNVFEQRRVWFQQQAELTGRSAGLAIQMGLSEDEVAHYARMAGFFGRLALQETAAS